MTPTLLIKNSGTVTKNSVDKLTLVKKSFIRSDKITRAPLLSAGFHPLSFQRRL